MNEILHIINLGRALLPRRPLIEMLLAFIVLCGSSASAQIQQAWVAKYNNGITNGNHQALKMAVDSTGNIYVLGVSANANTNIGYVVVKYAPNGNQIWTARYDSTNFPSATPTGFALDSSNAVVAAGNAVTVKYDANGNQLWIAPYNALGIGIDSGQNAYITGVSNNFTTIKLNPFGSNVWEKTFMGSDSQYVSQALSVDSHSNVYVIGKEVVLLGPSVIVGMLALYYDTDGNQFWKNNSDIGTEDYDFQTVGVALDKVDSFYVEANYIGNSVGSYSTERYYSDGAGGGLASDPTHDIYSWSAGIVVDSSEDIIVTGKYGTSFDTLLCRKVS